MTAKSPVGAGLLAHLGESLGPADRLVGLVHVTDPAVVPGGPGEGDLGEPADVDRDRRGRASAPSPSAARRRTSPWNSVQPGCHSSFIRASPSSVRLPRVRKLLLEQLELLLAPADADAEGDPVAGDHRGGADRLGDLEGAAERRHVDGGEEAQPARSPSTARPPAPTGPATARRSPSAACRRACRGTACAASRGRPRGRAWPGCRSPACRPPWRSGRAGRSAGRPC